MLLAAAGNHKNAKARSQAKQSTVKTHHPMILLCFVLYDRCFVLLFLSWTIPLECWLFTRPDSSFLRVLFSPSTLSYSSRVEFLPVFLPCFRPKGEWTPWLLIHSSLIDWAGGLCQMIAFWTRAVTPFPLFGSNPPD